LAATGIAVLYYFIVNATAKLWRRLFDPKTSAGLTILIAVLFSFAGCTLQRRKSDAELGLNPQQAAGRRIYDQQCLRCHEPYSSRGSKGPALSGVFKIQYLSKSGLPANDEQVGGIILQGRSMMPGFERALTDEQFQNLMAYLHTL
jgi:mono/diheme cytochrome c family protein